MAMSTTEDTITTIELTEVERNLLAAIVSDSIDDMRKYIRSASMIPEIFEALGITLGIALVIQDRIGPFVEDEELPGSS